MLGRRDAAERAMNSFRNQLQSDMATFKLEHESMLDDLYRNRDRLHRSSEAQSESLRRTITRELEGHHDTARSLDAERHRVQNRMDRSKRSHDMNFALMSDEFEYASRKLKFQTSSLKDFDTQATRIDDLAPTDCSQDASGQWTCFFANAAKDCESGDVIRWSSQEEATQYPVQCRRRGRRGAVVLVPERRGRRGRARHGPWPAVAVRGVRPARRAVTRAQWLLFQPMGPLLCFFNSFFLLCYGTGRSAPTQPPAIR